MASTPATAACHRVVPGHEVRGQDGRAVVKRHVDPGDLLEDEERADDDQRSPHPPGPLHPALLLPLLPVQLVRRAPDLVLGDVHAQPTERLAGVRVALMEHQPPRRLGHVRAQRHGDQRGNGAQPEDQPPVGVARAAWRRLENDHGHDVGGQDPHRDHPLLDDAQLPAPTARRELRNVGGGDRGVGSDRQPDQRAREQQHPGVRRDRRKDRADGVDGGVGDQQGLAPEMVGQRAGDERARRGAQRRPGHQVAGRETGQVVGKEAERRPDVGRVVSEEEPADARQDGEVPVEVRGDARVKIVQDVAPPGLCSLGLRHHCRTSSFRTATRRESTENHSATRRESTETSRNRGFAIGTTTPVITALPWA